MGPCGHAPRGSRTRLCPRGHGGRRSVRPAVAPARAAAGAPGGAGAGSCAIAGRLGRRLLPPFKAGISTAFPGALPRAPSPHGAEHAQVKTALPAPGLAPPLSVEGGSTQVQSGGCPSSRPHPHPQARLPERASTSSSAPLQIHQSRRPAARSSAGSPHSLSLFFRSRATGAWFCQHHLNTDGASQVAQ